MHLTPYWYICLTLFGLLFGSFFNVAIYRWPQEGKEREWVHTPSHCPKCKAPIKWYDNIPLVSWLMLRGRCRNCKAPISPQYILVEAGTALLWLGTAWLVTTHGLTAVPADHIRPVHVICTIVLASMYMLTVIIDLQTTLIPYEISIIQFVTAWALFFLARPDVISPSWQSSVICMLAVAAVFYLLALPGWMGDGDIWLVGGFGALFGWPMVIVVLMLGFMLGGLVAVPVLLRKVARKEYKMGTTAIPFGPYLAVSAFVNLFFGRDIINWYLQFYHLQLAEGWHVVSTIPVHL